MRVNRHHQLSTEQFNVLVLGLPWARLGANGIITIV
jgi:hypothetical protein